ncbi:glycosyltransferase [Mycoplasmatota bacterium zrk1]
MRILFLESHPMWIYGLPNGFRDLGHEVKVSGPLTEENIPMMISEFKPDLIITIGWTPENTGKKVGWIRKFVKQSKIPHVYWATEDPGYTHSFSLPLIQNLEPDFVFTICLARVDYYKKLGFKSAYMDFGHHCSVHKRVKIDNRFKCKIAVVANGYPIFLKENPEHFRMKSLQTLINPILKANLRIDFWGRCWDEMSRFVEYDIPKEWIHGYLSYEEVYKVYSSADIIIGLQNRVDQITQRTYETLGSEGLLLTSDTAAVRKLFNDKQDLLLSSSAEETLRLVYYFLNNPEESEKIRRHGKLSVTKHSYKHRAEYIIKILNTEGLLEK